MNGNKRSVKKLLIISWAINSCVQFFPTHAEPILIGKTFFQPRAQQTNAARDLTVWYPYALYSNAYAHNFLYTDFIAYNQSALNGNIARALFNTPKLVISGSQATNRADTDLLADYFGLSPEFESVITFKPRIKNITFNTGIQYNSDSFYICVQAPVVWTNWDLVLQEEIETPQISTPFAPGYMTQEELAPTRGSFEQAMREPNGFGNVQELRFGRIDNAHTKAAIANVYTELGVFVCSTDIQEIEAYFSLSAPTGNRAKSTYLFEPIVGNGKHWEPGVGIRIATKVWERCPDQELFVYITAHLSHLCSSKQTRSFDLLENGYLSRYMLLKVFGENQLPTGEVVPAINITTLACKVSVDIQADIALMFGYRYGDCYLNAGYNGWMKSKEKISLQDSISPNTYGLKGIQNIFSPDSAQLNNSTQHSATIFGDNFQDQDSVADSTVRFISTADLNKKSAANPFVLTHKLFLHGAHQWSGCGLLGGMIDPYIGLGGEIEFEGINRHSTVHRDKTTMAQWGIWLNGGMHF